MKYPVKHISGKPDYRYSASEEYCGRGSRLWVLRFAGEWITTSDSYTDIKMIANEHNNDRLKQWKL